jgi:hypothetical protein
MSTPDEDPQRARRNQLVGRILIVALGLVALAYIVPLFFHR